MSILSREVSFYDIPIEQSVAALNLATSVDRHIPPALRPFAKTPYDIGPHTWHIDGDEPMPHYVAQSIGTAYSFLNDRYNWDFKAAKTIHPEGGVGLVSIHMNFVIPEGSPLPIRSEGGIFRRRYVLDMEEVIRPAVTASLDGDLRFGQYRQTPSLVTLVEQQIGPFVPFKQIDEAKAPFAGRSISARPVLVTRQVSSLRREVVKELPDEVCVKLDLVEVAPILLSRTRKERTEHRRDVAVRRETIAELMRQANQQRRGLGKRQLARTEEAFAAKEEDARGLHKMIDSFLQQRAEAEKRRLMTPQQAAVLAMKPSMSNHQIWVA